MANRLRHRTSDQTVLGSNPAVAAALSPWTRLFTPIAFILASISYLAILVKYMYGLYPVERHFFARLYTRATLCSAQPK